MPAKLNAQQQRHLSAEATAALLEASSAINSSLDLTEVLNQVARSAAAVVHAEAASVLLLDRAAGKLVFRGACGDRGDVLLGERFDAHLGIAGHVARTGEPMLVPDAHAHPSFFKGIENKVAFPTRDLIAAPMNCKGELTGVVEVLNKIGPDPFDQTDVALLQMFASLAAIGATNAQRFEGLVRENQSLRDGQAAEEPQLLGRSRPIEHVRELCRRVAASAATVLLTGPTGTGKEVAARLIHLFSPRRYKPFIAVNCAALPETLLESELFGHEKGSFTGATDRKLGRFELADGGTLFLDEVGELSQATQVKLLRVLEEREFVRVGGTETIRTDARIIAATNRDLPAEIRAGRFREDLFYRLNVFPILMPSLAQRREDIPILVDHFARRAASDMKLPSAVIGPEVLALLTGYDWPGNVRELQNVIERGTLLASGGQIASDHLPREIVEGAAGSHAPAQSAAATGRGSLWDYERAMIRQALERSAWNQSRAARDLGISRDNLRYRMKKYQIKRDAQNGQ